jgi:hypothetical protein
MDNTIYDNLISPNWWQIDKIHYGIAYGEEFEYEGIKYSPLDPYNDGIMLGRYVLVKYTDLVLTQDIKNDLMKENPEDVNPIIKYNAWKKCYVQDKDYLTTDKLLDFDGVVFKKVYDSNELKYKPIA